MIRLEKVELPQVLIDNGPSWTAEYVEWCKHREGTEPRPYAHGDVRLALESETNSKCAYCEGKSGGVSYMHIEHKLPKRGHPTLVCDWDNLTLACPKCNTNKGAYDEPECPLLDPYVDDVETMVVFYGPLALARGGARSDATIKRLALNRADLLHARGQAIESLDRLLNLLDRAVGEPDVLVALWVEIEKTTSVAEEFASACRHFLASQIAERRISAPTWLTA